MNMPVLHRTEPFGQSATTGDTWEMAGQAPRGSRGHGRSSRPGSSLPRAETVPATGPAPVANATKPPAQPTTERAATDAPGTRAVYRLLLMKGMAPAEAANLTAYVCGLPVADVHWSLKQINQLLFLRAMRQAGRFDDVDGARKRPH